MIRRAGLGVVGVVALYAVAGAQTPSPKSGRSDVKKAHASIIKDNELAAGILRVNAYLGQTDRPLVGVLIAVRPDVGQPLQARTDAQGVATIGNLKPKGKYRVEALIQGALYGTKQLTMPEKVGLAVSLSPVAPQSTQGDGRPPPSRMHGIARGDQSDKAGTLTVRVLHGSWNHNAVGIDVHLVGYNVTGAISHQVAKTDGGGRARFKKLDRQRRTAYYAFALIPRPNRTSAALADKPGEHYDRVTSRTIRLPPKVGARMVLTGSARADTDRAYDNNVDGFGDRGWKQPPADEVQVEVSGGRRALGQLELVRVGGKEVEAVAKVTRIPLRARGVRMGRTPVIPVAETQLPKGTVYIRVAERGELMSGANPRAIPGAKVELIDNTTNKPVAGKVMGAATVFGRLKAGNIYTWKLSAFNRTFEGKPFEMQERGVYIPVPMTFRMTSPFGAVFKGVKGDPTAIYVVRAKRGGELFHSRPFQMAPGKGAFSKIDIGKRIHYIFDISGHVDDDRIIYQGQFLVINSSWFPYMPKDGRFIFHLPKGFKGETVHGAMESVVKTARDKGFFWSGALPPQFASFSGAWLVKNEDGRSRFDMDLPYGATRSAVRIKYIDGMKVNIYGDMQGRTTKGSDGSKYFTLNPLSLAAGKALVFDVTGLPKPPSWKRHLRYLAGLAALSLLIVGLVGVFKAGRRAERPTKKAGLIDARETLLEQLVTLERKHNDGEVDDADYERDKRDLIQRLETIYTQLDEHKAAG